VRGECTLENRAYGAWVDLIPPLSEFGIDLGHGTIGPLHDPHEVRELTLVLSSMQVPFTVRNEGDSWAILIPRNEHQRALDTIQLYRSENRDWPPRRGREILPYRRSLIAPAVFLCLVVFYAVTGPASAHSSWELGGAAASERILAGQIWRAATALTLHADAVHILGNAISGTIFLSAVNRRLGDGRGPLWVLLAGTGGNLLNAVWHRTGHISIGASTAVFAAVGILVSTQLAVNRQTGTRSWLERVAPVMGGLALLGVLGASPHSDLMAHFFGFLAGVALGAPFVALRRPLRPTSRLAQALSGVLALALIVGSWICAWLVRT
jgi:rhomboid protease GluP